MRQKKELTLEFFYDERTHWLLDDRELLDKVRLVNYSLAVVHTHGAKPAVHVSFLRLDTTLDCELEQWARYFCRACQRFTPGRTNALGELVCSSCHSPRLRLQVPVAVLKPANAVHTATT